MRKLFLIVLTVISFHCAVAQNVGVGTTTPSMPLHIKSFSDTAVTLIENGTSLGIGTNVGLYFKNGSYYSGAIKTTGTATNSSRLGLYAFSAIGQNSLKEYLSILDNGLVGIGTITPTQKLTVNGDGSFTNLITNFNHPTLDVYSATTTNGYPAISGNGAAGGVVGTSATGTGILGYSGTLSFLAPGIGVLGQSSNGVGVYGSTTKSGYSSIFGVAQAADIIAGDFENTSTGKALFTSGKLQFSGQGAGAGKVLTSDATGNATWEDVPVPATTTVAFSSILTNNTSFNTGSTLTPTAFTSQFNDGGGFNNTTGTFTAPVGGVYQFTVSVSLLHPVLANPVRIQLELRINGGYSAGCTGGTVLPSSTEGLSSTADYTRIIKLNTGDKVTLNITGYHVGGGIVTFTIGGLGTQPSTIFSGAKLD